MKKRKEKIKLLLYENEYMKTGKKDILPKTTLTVCMQTITKKKNN